MDVCMDGWMYGWMYGWMDVNQSKNLYFFVASVFRFCSLDYLAFFFIIFCHLNLNGKNEA